MITPFYSADLGSTQFTLFWQTVTHTTRYADAIHLLAVFVTHIILHTLCTIFTDIAHWHLKRLTSGKDLAAQEQQA
jgi:hypothetical protein